MNNEVDENYEVFKGYFKDYIFSNFDKHIKKIEWNNDKLEHPTKTRNDRIYCNTCGEYISRITKAKHKKTLKHKSNKIIIEEKIKKLFE